MKHLITLALLCLAFASCKAPDFTIGMSERNFKKHNNGIELVQADQNGTVYKKTNYPFGKPPKVKFFYFQDGFLTRMDEGVTAPDIVIQSQRQ